MACAGDRDAGGVRDARVGHADGVRRGGARALRARRALRAAAAGRLPGRLQGQPARAAGSVPPHTHIYTLINIAHTLLMP